MATDRTAIAKNLLGVLILVSFLLVVTAYGEALTPASPGGSSPVGTQSLAVVAGPATGSGSITGIPGGGYTLLGNSDSVNFGNGNTGSSRPDGVGAGKESGAANATESTGGNAGNISVSASQAEQVTATPIGLQGTNVTSTGTTQEITVDTRGAKKANETVSVEGTAVTVAKGPVGITITTSTEPNVKNGTITADIKSIFMNYKPVTAQFTDTGAVSASFTADLKDLPSQNATIAGSLAEKPAPFVLEGFDSAVKKMGYQMDTVAYTLNVAKTNLNDGTVIGNANVNMSISPAWVAAHGGVSNVKILRYADDGTYQVLDTRFVGLDSSGNMVFTGISPGGLSTFALVTVKAPQAAATAIPPPQPTQQPASQISLPINGQTAMLIIPPLIVLMIVILMKWRK